MFCRLSCHIVCFLLYAVSIVVVFFSPVIKISNFLRLLHTWLGSTEYSWDGNDSRFESERACFFFKQEMISFKKISAYYSSAYVFFGLDTTSYVFCCMQFPL